MKLSLKPSFNWFLVFIPITVALEHSGSFSPPLIFFSAALAIIPIAKLIVEATEHISTRTGDAVGGLLNATFGNAPELIIAVVALRAGLFDMVRASIIGAILANLLLALGVAFLIGGLRYRDQDYNTKAARIYSSMMLISVISLAVPSAFSRFFSPDGTIREEKLLNLGMAIVLLLAYGLYLLFMLKTHPHFFSSAAVSEEHHERGRALGNPEGGRQPDWRLGARGLDERDTGRRGGRDGEIAGHVADLYRDCYPGDSRGSGGERVGGCNGAKEQNGSDAGDRAWQLHSDRALRCACSGARELFPGPAAA